ncbi:MAG: hydrogenase maturation protease [Terriglobales bacterium]
MNAASEFGAWNPWAEALSPAPARVVIGGASLARGARVRIQPRRTADVLDLALAGQVGVIEAIEQDLEGRVQVSLVLESDPGRDLGELRQPGHRFFFFPDELAPLTEIAAVSAASLAPRILLAGIGNIFLGDDGFGPELARIAAAEPWPRGVEVRDYGIRGFDLAMALIEPWDRVALLDASPRGGAPGTVYWIELAPPPQPTEGEGGVVPDPHDLTPVAVLRLAAAMGQPPPILWLLGCEPSAGPDGGRGGGEQGGISPVVASALPAAVALLRRQVEHWMSEISEARAL